MLTEAKEKVNSEDQKYAKDLGFFFFLTEFYLYVGAPSSPWARITDQ